jgi:2,3-bisphosphoglycerate-dependent phosphoglycerate mutase
MRIFIVFIMLVSLHQMVFAQLPQGFSAKTKIYLVRHAEKETGKDPVLTQNGNTRAGDLMRTLNSKHLQQIYVTQYKRTQQTADSLRIQLGIDTIHYLADTTAADIFNKIISHNASGKTILIVGHSNTVIKIIAKLGVVNFATADIPDGEFDNLYLVRYKKKKAIVKKMKYGSASGGSAVMQ